MYVTLADSIAEHIDLYSYHIIKMLFALLYIHNLCYLLYKQVCLSVIF